MIDLESFLSARYVEHYDWYDGPLFYTIQVKEQFYALYLVDDRERIKTEMLIPLTSEEMAVMKTSPIRTWLLEQQKKENLYVLEMNYNTEPRGFHVELVTDITDKDDWFPELDWRISDEEDDK